MKNQRQGDGGLVLLDEDKGRALFAVKLGGNNPAADQFTLELRD